MESSETAPEPCTNGWVDAQVAEFKSRRDDYVLLGKVLQEVLEVATARYAPLAMVQVRAKAIPSFAEKCLRKCRKYTSPVDQMTDLCGGRIIVHTQEQVERISRFLEQHFEIDWGNSEDVQKRLSTTEFGYRSVHYIVTFRRGVFPTAEVPIEVPDVLYGGEQGMANPRAEVQVRTLLQHAWADVGHDLLYKGGFEAPEVWKREYARLAAMLEASDAAMGSVHGAIIRFLSSYKAYMDPDRMDAELGLLRRVRQHDPDSVDLALRIAGIANAAGKWDDAIETLEPFEATGDAVVLRELGLAYCGKGRTEPRGADYRRGQDLLEQAAQDPEIGGPALLCLAASWRGVNKERARAGFTRAFEALPQDPRALAGYLEHEIAFTHSLTPLTAAGPAAASAVETCESRVRAGIDVPGAYFTAGFLTLLLGKPYEAIDSFAKGIQLSSTGTEIAEALDALQHIRSVADKLEGHAWMVRLLQLGLAVTQPGYEPARSVVRTLASPEVPGPAEPVVMIAGGCDPAKAEQFERYREMVVRGLAQFSGTVIGGGTLEGVSGFVGDAAERNPGVHALSYLPRMLPIDATRDTRYTEIRLIDDAGFTPMAPLQAWTDLIAAGTDPTGIRVLGINGGRISAAEYRIALALGATVALVEDSGREADRMLPDEKWGLSRALLRLPADWASARSFVVPARTPLPQELRQAVARDLHAEFRGARISELRPDEPGIAEWDDLQDEYRESAMLQTDDIFAKLALVGLEAVPSDHPEPFTIPEVDVELLAEAEHGRWTVERLAGGWRWGPVKDVKTRISPYLVPWDRLSEETREWDRIFIRAIPETLARYGLQVRQRT